MKKINLTKRLNLNKESISELNSFEQTNIKGGLPKSITDCPTDLDTRRDCPSKKLEGGR